MKTLVHLLQTLEETSATHQKKEAIVLYLSSVNEIERLHTIALFCQRTPKRPVKIALFKQWIAEYLALPLWLIEECHHTVGDLSETISLLVSSETTEITTSLPDILQHLYELPGKPLEEIKSTIIYYWTHLDSYSCFVFNKLLSGNFRVGVSQNLIAQAIAVYTQQDVGKIHSALMGNWSPITHTWSELFHFTDHKVGSQPYPFYLAYPLEDTTLVTNNTDDWSAEYKWDGIRLQMVHRGQQTYLWSRGEELITDRFPEIVEAFQDLPDGIVLDGELVVWDEQHTCSFPYLQKRIQRKNVTEKILTSYPAYVMVYDILEYQTKDCRSLPYVDRRAILNTLLSSYPQERILLSKAYSFSNMESLYQLQLDAVRAGAEGLMIKRNQSEYQYGRKRGDWWKWKKEPFTVDAVLIYAMQGSGRRAGWYTDYTFAVWKGDQLVPFAKAYSGLSDSEIKELDTWIKKNTLEKFGPVRSVPAHHVFEIAFEGIALSSRHKSGIAVRFPRILRWRKDKPLNEANTLDDLNAMLSNGLS